MARLDIDLDKGLPAGVEQFPVGPGRIAGAELRPDHQHHVGLAKRRIGDRRPERAEDAERQRMRLGKRALPGRRRRHRHPCRLGERLELVVALRNAHAVAGNDDRPLGLEDRISRRGEPTPASAGGRRRGQVEPRRKQAGIGVGGNVACERVVAEQDHHGPRLPGHRVLDRELRRDHRLERLLGLHDLLGDPRRTPWRRVSSSRCNPRSPADRARAGGNAARR